MYISFHEHALCSSHGGIFRDLCSARDHYYHPVHLLYNCSCNKINELVVHQLAPDIKIDLNIVLKGHCYLCFLCAITLQFVGIYLYYIV